ILASALRSLARRRRQRPPARVPFGRLELIRLWLSTSRHGAFPSLPLGAMLSRRVDNRPRLPLGLHLGERPTIAIQARFLAGELLPAPDGDVDVSRADLHRVAAAAGHLGRNDRRAATRERLIDRLPWAAVVLDGAAHGFDGLLRRVPGLGSL